MSRIPYLTAEELSEEQRRLAEKLAASRGGRLVGPGAFWLRNPALADQADALRLFMERRTFAPSVSRFGYQTVIELVGVAGFYSMVALTLNAFEAMPARGRTSLPRFPSS
jgi:hypothetical protein